MQYLHLVTFCRFDTRGDHAGEEKSMASPFLLLPQRFRQPPQYIH